jgi:3-oxoadipate enol-lactonase
MQFARCGDLTVHYAIDGPVAAPPVLFINALGTDLRIWDEVAAALSSDYRIIRYDTRGHGLTDTTPGPYGIEQLAEDARALLDALEIDSAFVCGLSIGGMIAQQLAAAYPQRIRAAAFCGTALRIGTRESWLERAAAVRAEGLSPLVEAALERWFTPPFHAQPKLHGYRNMLARACREGYVGCCGALAEADLHGQAHRLTMPSLVLVGEHDVGTTPAMAKELAQALPNTRLQIVPNAAHLLCAEQPQSVAAALRELLGRGR